MRTLLFVGFVLNIAAMTPPDGNQSANISGYWLNDAGDVIVKIYQREDASIAGDIVWLADSLDSYSQPLRDVMNEDPGKRSRPVKGLTVLRDFKWSSDAWRFGTYYNYKNGNDYEIKMLPDENGNLRLTSNYGILFFLSKTRIWTPVVDKTLYGLK